MARSIPLERIIEMWQTVKFRGTAKFNVFELVCQVTKEQLGKMTELEQKKVINALKTAGFEAQMAGRITQGSISQSLWDDAQSETRRSIAVQKLLDVKKELERF